MVYLLAVIWLRSRTAVSGIPRYSVILPVTRIAKNRLHDPTVLPS